MMTTGMTKMKVLIADDDPIIRLDLKQMLQDLDYEVISEAGDGYQALKEANDLNPDICILDVKMPGMDGIEVAARISQSGICPVVLLTAYSDKELVQRAQDAGVFGYLVKPFKFNDLPPAMEVARGRFLENQELEKEVKSLEHKLEARKLIDIAKGILIDQYGLGETDAFRRIQTQSMQMRKSMKEIAEAIILAHNVQQGL